MGIMTLRGKTKLVVKSCMGQKPPPRFRVASAGIDKSLRDVQGSPVPIMVRDKPVIGQNSEIPLECADCQLPKDVPEMKAILTRPNGKDELIHVEEAPDQTIAVSFVPEEPGKHLIKVSEVE